MKLIGALKEKVEKCENLEEVRCLIEEAGMQLTDAEMEEVVGGVKFSTLGFRSSMAVL